MLDFFLMCHLPVSVQSHVLCMQHWLLLLTPTLNFHVIKSVEEALKLINPALVIFEACVLVLLSQDKALD